MEKPFLSNYEIFLTHDIMLSTVTRSLEDTDFDENISGRTITESLEDTDYDNTPSFDFSKHEVKLAQTHTFSLEDTDYDNNILVFGTITKSLEDSDFDNVLLNSN